MLVKVVIIQFVPTIFVCISDLSSVIKGFQFCSNESILLVVISRALMKFRFLRRHLFTSSTFISLPSFRFE